MNLLFIGRFYPRGIVESIAADTRGKAGFSNHNFEMSLIGGFAALDDVCLRVITAPMVFSFPHNNRRAFIPEMRYREERYTVRSVGFCNMAVLNMWSIRRSLTRAIREEIDAFQGDEVTVLVNTPSLTLSEALFDALKEVSGKKVTTVLVVPDVPECLVEMNGRLTLKDRLVQRINKKTAAYSLRYDKYVYLTEAMNDFYHAAPGDYIVMEGLIDASRITAPSDTAGQDKEIILYTGTLRRIFGVMNLVDAFVAGKFDNTELWICGSGECADEIARRASLNPAIKYYGLVDAAEARRLQSRATVLANPRNAEGRYTRYSFPSKTIEYLLAGKTVIMNRLPGIPAEYDPYLHYPADDSAEAWIAELRRIFDTPPALRAEADTAGRDFILNNKTAPAQCARITALASSI